MRGRNERKTRVEVEVVGEWKGRGSLESCDGWKRGIKGRRKVRRDKGNRKSYSAVTMGEIQSNRGGERVMNRQE